MTDTTLIQRLSDEADLCRNDGATDVAKLIDDAVFELVRQMNNVKWMKLRVEQQAHAAKVSDDLAEARERVIAKQTSIIAEQAAQINRMQIELNALAADIALRDTEVEALRADAERYRWLRRTTNAVTSKGERIDVRNNPELWDSAIDAALRQEQPT